MVTALLRTYGGGREREEPWDFAGMSHGWAVPIPERSLGHHHRRGEAAPAMVPKALQTVPAWPHARGILGSDKGVPVFTGCSSSSAERWLQHHKLPSHVAQEGSEQTPQEAL